MKKNIFLLLFLFVAVPTVAWSMDEDLTSIDPVEEQPVISQNGDIDSDSEEDIVNNNTPTTDFSLARGVDSQNSEVINYNQSRDEQVENNPAQNGASTTVHTQGEISASAAKESANKSAFRGDSNLRLESIERTRTQEAMIRDIKEYVRGTNKEVNDAISRNNPDTLTNIRSRLVGDSRRFEQEPNKKPLKQYADGQVRKVDNALERIQEENDRTPEQQKEAWWNQEVETNRTPEQRQAIRRAGDVAWNRGENRTDDQRNSARMKAEQRHDQMLRRNEQKAWDSQHRRDNMTPEQKEKERQQREVAARNKERLRQKDTQFKNMFFDIFTKDQN